MSFIDSRFRRAFDKGQGDQDVWPRTLIKGGNLEGVVVKFDGMSYFKCPDCGAGYKVVRAEGELKHADDEINCRHCGATFEGRDGPMVLKYFLVTRPRTNQFPVRAVEIPRISV
jgi:predicted Zn finger-like uncharacterized protein